MIVMKFGGTSVRDSDAMKRAACIVKSKINQQPLVVLSACAGITNRLNNLAVKANTITKDSLLKEIAFIEQFHIDIIEKLIINKPDLENASRDISKLCSELKLLFDGVCLLNECTARSHAKILSFGECLSSLVFSYVCKSIGVDVLLLDADSVMKTNANSLNAIVNYKKASKSINEYFSKNVSQKKIIITQGFIGSDNLGTLTTLGRGGSDYSAAIFASALKSEEIQIWTDVSGILTSDPNKISSATTISEMTFKEVRELAFYGAKVLHPDAIKPAIDKQIPVRILNSFQPENMGTLISDNSTSNNTVLRSVIIKEECHLITFENPPNLNAQEYYSILLNKISRQDVRIMFSLCSESNCQFIINSEIIVFRKLFRKLANYEFTHQAVDLMCICGSIKNENDEYAVKLLSSLFNILSKHSAIKIIFGASSVSILSAFKENIEQSALEDVHNLILSCNPKAKSKT